MTTETPTLTQAEIVRAATNDPVLAEDTFQLGDRVFPLVDLAYDEYLKFFAHLQPLLEKLASTITNTEFQKENEIDVKGLIAYCGSSLPEMVRLMCAQTDATVTTEDVKRLGKNPFALAAIVVKQIKHNHVIEDIGSFFVQILPMLNGLKLTK